MIRFSEATDGFLLNPVPTNPVRALNTNFTPNTTRPTLCIYTVQIQGQTTLLSGDDGTIELRSDTATPPVTVRCSVRNRIAQALGVTVGTQSAIRGTLTYLVPAGHNVRLQTIVTLAAPIFTLITATEITL